MPKLKTNKACLKRFRLTAKGKVKRTNAGSSHLMSGMSAKRRRNIRRPEFVSKGQTKLIRHLISR